MRAYVYAYVDDDFLVSVSTSASDKETHALWYTTTLGIPIYLATRHGLTRTLQLANDETFRDIVVCSESRCRGYRNHRWYPRGTSFTTRATTRQDDERHLARQITSSKAICDDTSLLWRFVLTKKWYILLLFLL